jgi:lysozyme family protein
MAKVNLSNSLRAQYQDLFDTCVVSSTSANAVEKIVDQIAAEQARYAAVAATVGAPWYFVAAIHNMESSLNFTRHLHNGDPLSARTKQVPAGRPLAGNPPFSWEESAIDALRLRSIHKWSEWTVPGTLYQLEGYNGWGYRLYHAHVLSPYLWAGSNHYTSGKYVADGKWSDTAISKQTGCAVILRRMAERGIIALGQEFAPSPTIPAVKPNLPAIRYSTKELPYGANLQAFLNQFPNIYLKVDGKPGDKTSEAFFAVTGRYLHGDPRDQP